MEELVNEVLAKNIGVRLVQKQLWVILSPQSLARPRRDRLASVERRARAGSSLAPVGHQIDRHFTYDRLNTHSLQWTF